MVIMWLVSQQNLGAAVQTAARPGGLYRHILLLHMFSVLKHSHLFQIEILQKFCCSNAVYDLLITFQETAEVKREGILFFVLNFCKIPAVR